MGKVRTKTIKKSAKRQFMCFMFSCSFFSPYQTVLVEKYFQKLTTDFQVNKKITSETTVMPSKKVRNKVAGYVTVLMKRIQRGPVRGISLKLQEEERERKLDYVPEVSALDREDRLLVSEEARNMLAAMGMGDLKRVAVDSNPGGASGGRAYARRPPVGRKGSQ